MYQGKKKDSSLLTGLTFNKNIMFSACARQMCAMMTSSSCGIKQLATILGIACAVLVQVFTPCLIQSTHADNL